MAFNFFQTIDDGEILDALRSGDVDLLCDLLDHTDADISKFHSTKLLTEACSVVTTIPDSKPKINTAILECLLKRGFSPNDNDTGLWRDTPLHTAALRGDLKAVELLLRYEANVAAVNRFGQTPLHHACRGGAVEVVEVLIKAGCDVDSKDCDECTPLFHAVAADKPDVVQVLIEKGANVDAVNDELLSALDQALIYNRRTMITLLLKAGCQIDHKKEGCIYYLGHYCNSVLYSLMADQDMQNIQLLVDCGYTVDCSFLVGGPWAMNGSASGAGAAAGASSSGSEGLSPDNGVSSSSSSSLPHRYDPAMVATLQHYSRTPRTLYAMCRISIRNAVNVVRNGAGPSLASRLDRLALPRKVRDYLTLREVEE